MIPPGGQIKYTQSSVSLENLIGQMIFSRPAGRRSRARARRRKAPLPNRRDRACPTATAIEFPVWRTPEGEPVSCVEKIKVLNENLAELRELAQEALEDAVLMGCDEQQVREVLAGIVAGIVNPYRK